MKCMEGRVQQFWQEQLIPSLQQNKRIIVVSHKNTLRCLFNIIQGGLDPQGIKHVEVPNARPIVYEFDSDNNFIKS